MLILHCNVPSQFNILIHLKKIIWTMTFQLNVLLKKNYFMPFTMNARFINVKNS